MRPFSLILTLLAIITPNRAPAANPLIIHEWGTFTSLHDEHGNTIGGINVEDEPLPDFVHRLDPMLLINSKSPPPVFFQGAPAAHTGVTMRLETPVIYFHLPENQTEPIELDLHVMFNGGWLTEFYPNAESTINDSDTPHAAAQRSEAGDHPPLSHRPLNPTSSSSLTWSNLRIGTADTGPDTDSHVWLAPRQVNAANVSTPAGEAERYLFYRGVGHVDAPLQVAQSGGENSLLFVQQLHRGGPGEAIQPPLWLLHVRPDGTSAFRTFDDMPMTPPAAPIGPAAFNDTDYTKDNIDHLRNQMHAAIVEQGLFPDEAEALLSTWELSYFQSPGMRLFFLVPQQWTDRILPLEVSIPADITRVMVARIELVGPRERELLKIITEGPASRPDLLRSMLPRDEAAYYELGRFRDALILDELRRRPTPALEQFITNYGLHPRHATAE